MVNLSMEAGRPEGGTGAVSFVGRLSTLIRERRVGFRMTETMRGTHRFEPGWGPPGTHPMSFAARWGSRHLFSEWLNPFSERYMTGRMSGTVTIGELCDGVTFEGSIRLRYFREAKIIYRFQFHHEGLTHRFSGEKRNLRPWNLLRTHTTLHGRLTREDAEGPISRSTLHFRWSSLPAMLGSFRFA